jgi:hypothetical protein
MLVRKYKHVNAKKEYNDLIPLLEAARYPLEEHGNTMYLI